MTKRDNWDPQQLPGGSATNHEAVTPSDTVDMPNDSRALYVGSTGNVAVLARGTSELAGKVVPYANVPDGTIIPIVARRVNATGTTATNIVAMF